MGSATGKLRREVLCCHGLSSGLQVLEPQLHSAGHASEAACRNRWRKSSSRSWFTKRKKICAWTPTQCFVRSPSQIAGIGHPEQRCSSAGAAWGLRVFCSRNQMLLYQQRYNVELNACCPYRVLFVWKNNP